MKIKSRYFGIMGLLCLIGLSNSTQAQKTLTIGDVLDKDITGTALNYVKDNLSLSDFKGKAIVLDFWATWCGPCVAELPKMDSLQKVYKDDLQIVLVTAEPKKNIEFFFTTGKGKGLSLPSIINHRELYAIFRHKLIPHKVWLDRNHKVVAITGSEEFNKTNIEHFVKNEQFSFKPKIDILDFDRTKPYLIDNNGGTSQKIISNSILAGYNDGLGSSFTPRKDNLGRYTGVCGINMDLLKLLVMAYGGMNFRNTTLNRTFVNVKDSSRFVLDYKRNISSQWMQKNAVCYDLQLPRPTKNMDSVCMMMQQDLRRAFPYYGKMEKREIDCWVLCRTSTIDKIKTKGQKPFMNLVTAGEHRLVNTPLSRLIDMINIFSPYYEPYFVDQTNYTGNVDIELGTVPIMKQDEMDIAELKKQLQKYDLDLVKKKTLVDVMVIYQD